MEPVVVVQVERGKACAGLVFQIKPGTIRYVCTEAAPILRKDFMGRSLDAVLSKLKKDRLTYTLWCEPKE